MGQKNYESNLNLTRFQAKQIKISSQSIKSNYKFHIKILKQNVQIIQIKYINLKLDNKSYMHSL